MVMVMARSMAMAMESIMVMAMVMKRMGRIEKIADRFLVSIFDRCNLYYIKSVFYLF